MIHCVVCSTESHPREAEHGLLCHGDSNRILRHLRELEEYLPTLSLEKSPAGSEPVTGPGFSSRSPSNDSVIVHTDPRSGADFLTRQVTKPRYDKHGNQVLDGHGRPVADPVLNENGDPVVEAIGEPSMGALGVVSSWAQVVTEERGVKPSTSAFLDISLLRMNHDWIAHQVWVDEYASELRQVHAAVRVLAHDPVPRSVGSCISIDKRGYDCGGQVFEMDDASGVKCSKCNRRYDGTDLIRFRIAQDGAVG